MKNQPSPAGTADVKPGTFVRRRPQPSLRDSNSSAWRPPTLKCWAILTSPAGTLALARCSAERLSVKDESKLFALQTLRAAVHPPAPSHLANYFDNGGSFLLARAGDWGQHWPCGTSNRSSASRGGSGPPSG